MPHKTRRLARPNIEVKMRPAAAAAFLAQHADLLAHGNPRARPDRRIDELQVAVAAIPAASIKNIDIVVARFRRRVRRPGRPARRCRTR